MTVDFSFFNATATTEIYTLFLHDALPIWMAQQATGGRQFTEQQMRWLEMIRDHVATSLEIGIEDFDDVIADHLDRKSTRLNSSHTVISYAVFCLKKKRKQKPQSNETHYDE